MISLKQDQVTYITEDIRVSTSYKSVDITTPCGIT